MDDVIASAICTLFALGDPIAEPVAVPGGLTNRLWRLPTARGVFAVKQMNRNPERTDYVAWFDRAFALELAAFLAGVPMPRPVPVAASGCCLGEVPGAGGRPITVRVHEWVDGEPLVNGRIYPADVITRVAAVHARIHALRMTADARSSEALRIFGGEYWRTLVRRFERDGMELAAELRQLLPVLAELESYVAAAHRDPTPLLLSHRDSDQKNFMRTAAGDLLLVDWDAAGPVNPRHDIANEALVWAGVHVGDPDVRVARLFVDAYRDVTNADLQFQPNDLAELVALRLGWFEFNVHRALGERIRDDSDREIGLNAIRRNVEQLPRFARSLQAWLAILAG